MNAPALDLLPPLIALLAAGLAAGFAAGLFGIGGGFVVVPALLVVMPLLGGEKAQYAHVAIGTSAATIIFTSLRSVRAHARRGAVDFEVLRSWAPWLVVGTLLGVALADRVDGHVLLLIFATGVLVMALTFLLPILADRVVSDEMPGSVARVGIAGGLGTFSSLLGIGGGTIAVLVMTLCGRTIHRAIATASGVGTLIAVPSALGFALIGRGEPGLPWGSLGYVNLPATLAIAATSMLTAPWGAAAAHSLDAPLLKRVFGLYLVAIGITMMRKATGLLREADMIERIVQEELLDRGYSRRQLGRVAALIGMGVAAGRALPAAAQQAARPVAGAVRIGANECWTGPFPVGVQAAAAIAAIGNRYEPDDEHAKLFAAVAAVEGVPADRVLAWPGSSDPLNRAAITFASPTRGIVTANPAYEQIWRTGAWLGAKVTRVPLTADYRHDVHAMLAADPNAGLYHICSPNNPTGTLTPIADIEWLAANKPADAILLVDEAYIHFAGTANAARLAASRDDVIVMRTFSKLFGMAGMRLGLTMASPAVHAKMMRYDGGQVTNMLPMTAVACGTASLPRADLIAARRAEMIAVRDASIAHVERRGFKVIPGSHANMFMVDWKMPARGMQQKLLAERVQIGRSWDIWPNVGRVSVGSESEMAAFRAAVDRVA